MNKMNYLILGAGRMGRAIAYDLIRSDDNNMVSIVDINRKNLEDTKNLAGSKRLACFMEDIRHPSIWRLLPKAKVVIGAASYKQNYSFSLLAISFGANYCDLGGNSEIVRKQFQLDNAAKEYGLNIIPDCGLAPGMMSILTADAMKGNIFAEEIKLRVGGLPQNPKGLLNYMIVFSPEGLINEYIEDCDLIKNWDIKQSKGMSGLEKISFEGFPELEAFHTSGGASTLTDTYLGRVKNLDYKTIRYAGHCEKMKKLLNIFEITPESRTSYRKELEKMLESAYSYKDKDLILARATIRSKDRQVVYELIDYEDEKTELTAMMRTTGFPASIIAQMIALKQIKGYGVRKQELAVPSEEFIKQLRKRGINLEKKDIKLI